MSTKISSLPAKTIFNDTDLVIVSTDNGSSYTSEKMTIAQLKSNLGLSVIPKRYKALISQRGELAPTAIVLENTIGVVSWSRITTGTYHLEGVGLFPYGKTFCNINRNNQFNYGYDIKGDSSSDYVLLNTYDMGGGSDDYLPEYIEVEIEVYE